MIETPWVHSNGPFLGWHRKYVHLLEVALRDECGYTGAVPYYDWTLTWQDQRNASIFDGSDASMGSDGIFIPNREPTVTVNSRGRVRLLDPANGGGCVERGPFTADKWEIRLGPKAIQPSGPDDGLGYNPRCMKRDFNIEVNREHRPSNITTLLGCQDYACFGPTVDLAASRWGGAHGVGHLAVGGDEADGYSSPADPIFFNHHANLDRLWAIWQELGSGRKQQLFGTITSGNFPPSENATFESETRFPYIGQTGKIGDYVSTIDGEFCYIYV